MSQAGILNVEAGDLPVVVPTKFTTDLGDAIPSGNILDVKAIDISDNNDNGIQTRGGASSEGAAGNDLEVQLTNRITGSTSTSDAVANTQNIFDLDATAGVYTFWGKIVAFNSTSALGASWDIEATVRTTGVAGTEIAIEVKNGRIEGAMISAVVSAGVSGNFFTLTVQGYGTEAINWNLLVEYRFVS